MPVLRVEDLFGPSPQLDTPGIELDGLGVVADLPMRLGQIEDRPGVVGLLGEVTLEQLELACRLVGSIAAVRVVLHDEAVEEFGPIRAVAGEVLVRRPDIAPRETRANQSRNPVCRWFVDEQGVRVGIERAKLARDANRLVGVQDQQVVGLPLSPFEHQGAVRPVVTPLVVEQFSRQVAKR